MDNQNQLKIVVALHEGDKITNKIWRFDVNLAPSYTKIQLEHDVEGLFPHISKKGLKLQLHHYDELVGKLVIDSDVDAVEALNDFIEESRKERRSEFIVLHAEDVILPLTLTTATEVAWSKSSGKKPQKV